MKGVSKTGELSPGSGICFILHSGPTGLTSEAAAHHEA
jgi:hypothetical protein